MVEVLLRVYESKATAPEETSSLWLRAHYVSGFYFRSICGWQNCKIAGKIDCTEHDWLTTLFVQGIIDRGQQKT